MDANATPIELMAASSAAGRARRRPMSYYRVSRSSVDVDAAGQWDWEQANRQFAKSWGSRMEVVVTADGIRAVTAITFALGEIWMAGPDQEAGRTSLIADRVIVPGALQREPHSLPKQRRTTSHQANSGELPHDFEQTIASALPSINKKWSSDSQESVSNPGPPLGSPCSCLSARNRYDSIQPGTAEPLSQVPDKPWSWVLVLGASIDHALRSESTRRAPPTDRPLACPPGIPMPHDLESTVAPRFDPRALSAPTPVHPSLENPEIIISNARRLSLPPCHPSAPAVNCNCNWNPNPNPNSNLEPRT
ncbi:hypothetical protein B0H15DRAFT_1020609 [Mycena belliarum]|uniref:Uncharacterized protein n=1 Tax=Mycena belliarum TaxID=1033014 RepID=A0AAD6XT93_9AGAR|nr:hypothetical protein B0H15DRAFT_1020609 [Mycena belliae]